MKMTYRQLREMWFDFYRAKSHAIMPSAPVVPENDPSTLFTTAGMQPLVPFLLGASHPAGKRISNIQRCIRTNDIEEVGDNRHLTFFEMMGNWSLGDYFKREKVAWSYELLTSEKYLALPKDKIHVTVFEGDTVAPRDDECAKYWEECGIPRERIHFLPKGENWWAMSGGVGPQGPCSEMFIFDKSRGKCSKTCNPSCDCGAFTELGNDVYMQYVVERAGDEIKLAKQKNVDTGWGLERILCFVNGHKTVFDTELFAPAIDILKTAGVADERAQRIVAEHVRAGCVIIADGVVPANTGAGYVLRRLIRRAVRSVNTYKIDPSVYKSVIKFYNSYLDFPLDRVTKVFLDEVSRFEQTITNGIREFEKEIKKCGASGKLSGKTAFYLYETYGFPIELTTEMAGEVGASVDMAEYETAKTQHSNVSRSASAVAGVFKGGLADSGIETTKLHTAAHILLAVLRQKYGDKVTQKGSNITPERLRYDFSLDRKIEAPEIAEIEKAVNDIISRNLDVTCAEMPIARAREIGATGSFADKYGDVVKVYTIGSGKGVVSMEICGGPHVGNTREIGVFKIQKEESVGAGVRRIKAVVIAR
jgi:alanyl-tRNA synthetase